jgi:hypothetical protein
VAATDRNGGLPSIQHDWNMTEIRVLLRTVGIAIVALVILVVAFSPTLVFGSGLSAFSLLLTAASLLGTGLLLRRTTRADARTLGSFLAIIGGVLLALSAGLTVLLLAGAFRGY